jgi:hypothetical protein
MRRFCKTCKRMRPVTKFEGKRQECRACRAVVQNKRKMEDWHASREPKPWPLVSQAYQLTRRDTNTILVAAKRYGLTNPCPDDIICAHTPSLRRQCELLTCVAYRLRLDSKRRVAG